ncbi:MAG: twin-arginine translocase TatA/TatE family subunit [Acidobacteriaceae bacterium]|nr:twin-arginine translocase TatA/TatE family subunit [Acidobacteriaceae bacterium]
MPSFSDSIFLFVLALLLFGPKKLPVLARELGKWLGEFRRASNEFKMQMEEELRVVEQSEREEKIAAIEAAAPVAPAVPASTTTGTSSSTEPLALENSIEPPSAATPSPSEALPIAESGEMKMMPPTTGLPAARKPRASVSGDPLGNLLDRIPTSPEAAESTETARHD